MRKRCSWKRSDDLPKYTESRRELDHQLDPNDPFLLECDRNRTEGTLTDITRSMLRSVDSMPPAEKESVRDALDRKLTGDFTADDVLFLRSIGSDI